MSARKASACVKSTLNAPSVPENFLILGQARPQSQDSEEAVAGEHVI
jgi:hypothetical protein